MAVYIVFSKTGSYIGCYDSMRAVESFLKKTPDSKFESRDYKIIVDGMEYQVLKDYLLTTEDGVMSW